MPGTFFSANNTYECIYRCWERITSVIKSVCYPTSSEKKYFDGLLTKLSQDRKFNKVVQLKELEKRVKHWNKIAKSRNRISHGNSSPFHHIKIEGKVSEMLTANGAATVYLDYSVDSPKKELEKLIEKYQKVLPVIAAMKSFIDILE